MDEAEIEIKKGFYFYCGDALMLTIRKWGNYWSCTESTGDVEEDKDLSPNGSSFAEDYIRKHRKIVDTGEEV